MVVNRQIGILGCIFFFLLSLGCQRKKDAGNLPDLRLTLGSNDTRPFGASVFRNILQQSMPEATLNKNAQPFDTWYRDYIRKNYHEARHTYVLVTPYLDVREKEVTAMKNFVERGNVLWICTNGVSEVFNKSFKTGIFYRPMLPGINEGALSETQKYLADSSLFEPSSFQFYFYPLAASVDTPETTIKRVISYNTFMKPDGWQMKFGSGELILISNAEALGNYFLLTGENYNYALGLLSYIPEMPEKITYDEFYRRNLSRQPEDRSMFDAILSEPPLRWAFWIILGLIALAIFTNLFRRQRIIPVKVPNHNTTVAFTETIARLYYNQKDNNNIAQKMIQHFLEHIRSVYYLPHQKLDREFARVLAGKTNQPVPKTERLVQRMSAIMQGMEVSDDLLLELNKDLQELKSGQTA